MAPLKYELFFEVEVYEPQGGRTVKANFTPTGKYNIVATTGKVDVWIEGTYDIWVPSYTIDRRTWWQRLLGEASQHYRSESVTKYVNIELLHVRSVERRTFGTI